MIRSVVREHHWPYFIIDRMYIDNTDHKGIEFWYEDIQQMNSELKAIK